MSAFAGRSDIEVKGFCFLHRTCPLLGAKRTSLLPHVTFPKGQYRPLRSSARIRRVRPVLSLQGHSDRIGREGAHGARNFGQDGDRRVLARWSDGLQRWRLVDIA